MALLSSSSRSRAPMTPSSWRSRMTSFANLARRSGTSAKNEHVLYDLKYVLGPDQSDLRL